MRIHDATDSGSRDRSAAVGEGGVRLTAWASGRCPNSCRPRL